MRKNVTKVVAALLSAAMVVTSVSVPGSKSEAASKVKISSSKTTLYVGGPAAKKKASLTVKQGSKNLTKKCTWTSKNKKVVTVKAGKVTAKKKGKAVVTAKYKGKSYKCTVTVKAYKYATGLKVSPSTLQLEEGGKKTITVKYSGSPTTKGVTFKSSSSAVASVSAKGVVTAKKEGTAKITVSTKAGVAKKTIKKTVTVTVTAKAPESAAPASAAPASDAPASTAPATGAPASTAPAATASSAPATATAAATATPVPQKDKTPTEIVVDNTKPALTNSDNTEAYLYYDVKNAAGESVRSSVDVTWNLSPGKASAKKSTGLITVKLDKDNYRPFSDHIVGVGVAATSEYSLTKTVNVEVGLKRALDSIQIAGFVSKDDPTNVVTSLPDDFAKNTWYLVFKTFDQNGCQIDMSGKDFSITKDLTITSKNPMLLQVEDKDVNGYTKRFSTTKIDGKADTDAIGNEVVSDYEGVLVQPGQWVDKGGEVSLMIVPTNTGNVAEKVFVVGQAPLLNSLKITNPVNAKGEKIELADGDGWWNESTGKLDEYGNGVKFDYEALDTKGNKVTSYETIVRSSNTLNLNCSGGGELKIVEENDGTAGIYWRDDRSRAEYDQDIVDANKYAGGTRASSDGAPRYLVITTVVIGGAAAETKQIEIKDARIPEDVVKVTADSHVMETGSVSFKPTQPESWLGLTFRDNYGDEMNNERAAKFFAAAIKGDGWSKGSVNKKYGVKVTLPDTSKFKVNKKKETVYTYGDEVKFAPGTIEKSDTETIRFSVASTKDNKDPKDAAESWNEEGNAKAYSLTYVDRDDLQSFYVKGLDKLYQVSADTDANPTDETTRVKVGPEDTPKGSTIINSAKFTNGKPEYKVYGKYEGNDVQVPFGQGWIHQGSDSRFVVTDANKLGYLNVKLNDAKSQIKAGNLFDYSAMGYPAKNVSYDAKIAIAKSANADGTELRNAQDMASYANVYLNVSTNNGNAKSALTQLKEGKDEIAKKVAALDLSQKDAVEVGTIKNVTKELNDLGALIKAETFVADDGEGGLNAEAALTAAQTAFNNAKAKIDVLDYTDSKKIAAVRGTAVAPSNIAESTDFAHMGLLGQVMAAIKDANVKAGSQAGYKSAIKAVIAAIDGVYGTAGYVKDVKAFKDAYTEVADGVAAIEKKDDQTDYNKIKTAWAGVKNAYAKLTGVDAYADEKLVGDFTNAISTFKTAGTGMTGLTETNIEALDDSDDSKVADLVKNKFVAATAKFTLAKKMEGMIGDHWTETKPEDAAAGSKTYYIPKEVSTVYNGLNTPACGSIGEAATVADLIYKNATYFGVLGSTEAAGIDKIGSIAEAKTFLKNAALVTGKVDEIYKEVKICAAPSVATKIIMDSTKTIKPYYTGIKVEKLPGSRCDFNAADYEDSYGKKTKKVVVVDQYGNVMEDEKIIYTISEYKEATGRDTHVIGKVVVDNNGSETPSIGKYAEIGDTFMLTAKVSGTSLTKACKVTVGADEMACISSKVDGNKDELLRKYDKNGPLGMIR